MANALTTLTHTLLAQTALEAFLVDIAPLMVFARNFSDTAAQRGDKVKVPFISAADAAVNFAGTYTIQDADAEGKDITLDKHKFVSWGLTDLELVNNPQVELERFARQKGHQLAKAVFQDIMSQVTNANYGAAIFTGAASSFDSDDLVDIREDLVQAGFPEMGRALILKETYYSYLLKDNDVKDASFSGTTDPIQQGAVRRLLGMDIYESTLIPANGENLVGVACHPDGILFAGRYLAPQPGHNYANAQAVTDPQTGITLGFREWYDNDTGTMKRVLEVLYGYQVGNTSALKRLVSA